MEHPILGELIEKRVVKIQVDGKLIDALDGEPIAAALIANGIKTLRYTKKKKEPRGIFCAIGQCSDCIMTVDGRPNVRTCVTQAKDGMKIETPNKEKQL
jgi:predicted molibdopterin-dependent oxidoreductase YjgC